MNQNGSSPLTTWEKSSSGVLPKKGTQPTRNSKRMIPIDHQSTGLPERQAHIQVNYPRCVTLYSLDSTVSDMTDGLSQRQTHTQVISLGISRGSCTFWTQQWHDSWCVWKSCTYTDHYPKYMKFHSSDSNGRLYSWFAWKASTNTDDYALYLKLHNLWTEQWHHTVFSHVKPCGHDMHFHTQTHILLLFLCNWTEVCAKTHTHIHIRTSTQTNHSLLAGWPQVRCTQVYQTPACPGTVCCPCPVHLHTSWWSLEKHPSTLISKPRLRKTEELQHCLCKTWRMWVNVMTQ